MAIEYDPAGHGAQTDDDVAPAVGSIRGVERCIISRVASICDLTSYSRCNALLCGNFYSKKQIT